MPRRLLPLTGLAVTAAAAWLAFRGSQPPGAPGTAAPIASRPPATPAAKTGSSGSRPDSSPVPPRLPLPLEPDLPPSPQTWTRIIEILLHGPDGEERATATRLLQAHAGPYEVATLAQSLEETPDPNVARRVIHALSNLQSDPGIEAARQLLAGTSREPDDPLMVACALSLARRGTPADIDPILQKLDATQRTAGQTALAQALAATSNPAAEAFLIGTAIGHGTAIRPHTRAAAATALRHFPSQPTTEALHKLATSDPEPAVQHAARTALDAIQTPE